MQNCTCENGKAASKAVCETSDVFKNSNSSCIACNIGYTLDLNTYACYKSDHYWSVHYLANSSLKADTRCAPNIVVNFARKAPMKFENNLIATIDKKWSSTAFKIGYNISSLNSAPGQLESVEIHAACEDEFSGRIRIDTPDGVFDLQTRNIFCNSPCTIGREQLSIVESIFCVCPNGFPHANDECISAGSKSCKSCFEGYYLEDSECKEYCDLYPSSVQCLESRGWSIRKLENPSDSTDQLLYKFFADDQKSFNDSRQFCQTLGSSLALMINEEEEQFAKRVTNSDLDFWIEHYDQAINETCYHANFSIYPFEPVFVRPTTSAIDQSSFTTESTIYPIEFDFVEQSGYPIELNIVPTTYPIEQLNFSTESTNYPTGQSNYSIDPADSLTTELLSLTSIIPSTATNQEIYTPKVQHVASDCSKKSNFLCQIKKPYKSCDYNKGLKWHSDGKRCECMPGFVSSKSNGIEDLECSRICNGGGQVSNGFSCQCQKGFKKLSSADVCYNQVDGNSTRLRLVEPYFENNEQILIEEEIIDLEARLVFSGWKKYDGPLHGKTGQLSGVSLKLNG